MFGLGPLQQPGFKHLWCDDGGLGLDDLVAQLIHIDIPFENRQRLGDFPGVVRGDEGMDIIDPDRRLKGVLVDGNDRYRYRENPR